jgi:hypothetical protein
MNIILFVSLYFYERDLSVFQEFAADSAREIDNCLGDLNSFNLSEFNK